MKNAISVVVALCAVGCTVDDDGTLVTEQEEQQVGNGNVWHSNQKGASASASEYGPYSSAHLNVWEYGSGSTRSAGLDFYRWSVDPTSQTCVTYDWGWGWGPYTYCYFTRYSYDYAWGAIPGQDFRANGKAARLSTTITSTMYSQHCEYDASSFMYSCEPATDGTIDVTWNADGAYSQFHSGVNHQTYGTFTFKTQGQLSSASAKATGTVLGQVLNSGYAFMADSKGTTVGRDISTNP